MKTLLVAALVLVPCLAWAEAETNAPAQTAPSELEGLTAEQQKQAEPILAAEAKQKKAIEENKSLAPLQKDVEISKLHRSTLVQIQALKAAASAPAPAPAKP